MGTSTAGRPSWLGALRRAAVPLGALWGACLVIIVVDSVRHDWRSVTAVGVVLVNGVWVTSILVSSARPEALAPRPEDVVPPDPSSPWAVPPPSRRALRWQLGGVTFVSALFVIDGVVLVLVQAWLGLLTVAVFMMTSLRWMPHWLARWQERWRTADH